MGQQHQVQGAHGPVPIPKMSIVTLDEAAVVNNIKADQMHFRTDKKVFESDLHPHHR